MFIKIVHNKPTDPNGFVILECRELRVLAQEDGSYGLILNPGDVEYTLTGAVAFVMNDEGKTIDKVYAA